MRYVFPNIKLLSRLDLDIENRDGRLVARAGGPLGLFLAWPFSRYLDVYNGIGPVGTSGGANVYTLYVPPIPGPVHARDLENVLRRWFLGTRIPLAVTIGVTNRCQCRCVHCSAIDSLAGEPLSLEELKRVVTESVDLGVTNVTFTGGEPLLCDDLEQLVAAVPADRALSLVFTNGIALTAARARRLKDAGLRGFQISLDSPDPQEHDRLRGWPGCFDAVRAGVAVAREAGLLVGLSTYATNEFVQEGRLARIASLGASWGVHELTVFDAIPSGRLRDQEICILTPENRAQLIRDGVALRDEYRGRLHIVTQAWTTSGAGFARIIGCLAGHFQFHVTADGQFRPCDFTPLSFGSVREAPVSDLWARLTAHPAYRRHSNACRMQCRAFREKYLGAAASPAST